MSIVAIEKCSNYEFESVYSVVKKTVLALGGLNELKGKKILLKPNLLAPSAPEKAVTTHPVFLKAVIKNMKDIGVGEIFVGDSPGVGTQGIIYKATGLEKIIIEENVKFANFKEKIELKTDGKYVKSFSVAKAFEEVDIIISLPKLKTHGMTYYTGAVKNMFGMVPGFGKPEFHYKFPDKSKFGDMLIDLNFALKPHLAIMDAIVSMEGNGPRSGNPINLGLVLASKDLLALDATACRIINLDPEKVLHLKNGYDRKYGSIQKEEIKVVGAIIDIDTIVYKKYKHIKRETGILELIPIPNFIGNLIREVVVPKPVFNHKKCIMCKECIKVCPSVPKSLEIKDDKIKIDRKTCIRCFCCQEMCPVSAITPKIFTIGD